MRILQISPRFPFPMDDGGKIGIGNILKEFSKQGDDVTFFTFENDEFNKDYTNEAEKYCKLVTCKYNTNNTPTRILKSLINGKPIFISKFQHPNIYSKIDNLLKTEKFDVIHSDHSSMAPLAFYAKSIINKPVGVRLHNIEWMIWERYAETFSKYHPARIYLKTQAYLLRNAESNIYKKADVCFAITEVEKKRALAIAPDSNVVVASAGVNPEEWNPCRIERNKNELILATTYKWIHNIDGLKWFLDKVYPIVRKECLDVKLNLIGKNPPNWLENYKEIGVNSLGYLPEVQSYLNKASIYISPLFVGGGIRIKILEAMSMELPVVATPVAAEGINANSENGLFIEHDANVFAQKILFLLNNPDYLKDVGIKARRHIISEYSWSKNVGIMIDSYKKLIK